MEDKLTLNNITEISALDILSKEESSNKICCRMLLLRQGERHILIEPVLDYLNNDELIAGLSISSLFMDCSEEAKNLLVSRHVVNGFGSLTWLWEKIDAGVGEVDISIFPIAELPNVAGSNRINIYQTNGNVCYQYCA